MSQLRLTDPLFGDAFDTALRRLIPATAFESTVPDLKMRLDVTESPEAYQVKADIPGVKKEDIRVRIDGNVVRIDAESRSEREEKGNGDKVLRSERCYGTISRSFSLAQDIDEARVEARYADGVLSLLLPKRAPAAGRQVVIQ